jgi:hypothetical protein
LGRSTASCSRKHLLPRDCESVQKQKSILGELMEDLVKEIREKREEK